MLGPPGPFEPRHTAVTTRTAVRHTPELAENSTSSPADHKSKPERLQDLARKQQHAHTNRQKGSTPDFLQRGDHASYMLSHFSTTAPPNPYMNNVSFFLIVVFKGSQPPNMGEQGYWKRPKGSSLATLRFGSQVSKHILSTNGTSGPNSKKNKASQLHRRSRPRILEKVQT